jgi:hypothetical protein
MTEDFLTASLHHANAQGRAGSRAAAIALPASW